MTIPAIDRRTAPRRQRDPIHDGRKARPHPAAATKQSDTSAARQSRLSATGASARGPAARNTELPMSRSCGAATSKGAKGGAEPIAPLQRSAVRR